MAVLRALLVMGVSGAGKSTVGAVLASELGWKFYDADDYHPEENRVKMAKGIPLTDQDRSPWLCNLHDILLRSGIDGSHVEEPPHWFAQCLKKFTLPEFQEECMNSSFSVGSLAFCAFDNGHSNLDKIVSYCLTLISLISDTEYFSCICWPFVYLLLRNIHSDHLPIFKIEFYC
ncbi:probable gluconokinase isoform X5 [Heterocephalus glaber]|uniref:gluconokinase n=1 Tax=Heterocephalus glaber TaxID=10181 RepID=A0AAX6RQJ3_HETGA|nr:probable gluconokinase isoform X5 [Heterocephalus glaber]